METDPGSEKSHFLEYWMMDRNKKASNHGCYTPSSKPFRIYQTTIMVKLAEPLLHKGSHVVLRAVAISKI
jgi:hypothetical protein